MYEIFNIILAITLYINAFRIGTNWKESELREISNAALSISSVDEWSDHRFINAESFTQPSALYYANESKDFKKIKSLPEKFAPEKVNLYEYSDFHIVIAGTRSCRFNCEIIPIST